MKSVVLDGLEIRSSFLEDWCGQERKPGEFVVQYDLHYLYKQELKGNGDKRDLLGLRLTWPLEEDVLECFEVEMVHDKEMRKKYPRHAAWARLLMGDVKP